MAIESTQAKKPLQPATSPNPAVSPAAKAVAKAVAPTPPPAPQSTTSFQPAPIAKVPIELHPPSAATPLATTSQPVRASEVLRRGSEAFTPPSTTLSTGNAIEQLGKAGTNPALNARLALALGTWTGSEKVKPGGVISGLGDGVPARGPDGLPTGAKAITADAAEHAAETAAAEAAAQSTGAAAVQQAYEQGGAKAAAAELDRQTAALGNDQAAVDQLIAQTQPILDQIAQDAVAEKDAAVSEAIVGSLANVANRASDEGVRNLARPLAEAIPNSWDTQDRNGQTQFGPYNLRGAFEHLADKGEGSRLTLALSAELDAAHKPTSVEITNAAYHGLDVAKSQYADAREAREAADAELQRQLDDLGGALTPEEQAAYVEEYHKQHPEYAKEAEEAQQFEAAVAPNTDLINQVTLNHPDHSADVVNVMTELARSPTPAAAVEWAVDSLQDGSPTADLYALYAGQIASDVVEPGLPGTLTQYQAESGNPNAAIDRFGTLFSNLKKARKLYQGGQSFAKAEEWLNAAREYARGNRGPLQKLASSGLKELSGFAKAFASASVVFGVVNAATADDANQLLTGLAGAGRAGAELYASAIASLNNSGRLAQLGQDASEAALKRADFAASKLIPGLGIAINVGAAATSLQRAIEDGGFGNWTSFVGNAISVLGSVFSAIPGGQVPGKIAEAIGTLVTLVGDAITGANARDEEEAKILKEVWKDNPYFQRHPGQLKQVAENVAEWNADLGRLQQTGGLSQAQLFEVINKYGTSEEGLKEFTEVAASVGLQGGALVDALDKLVGKYGSLNQARAEVGTLLSELTSAPPHSRQRETLLQQIASLVGIEGPDSP